MKTPITYYGGKQNMVKHILPLIPKHDIYVEPFFGGGAVFFAKVPGKREIINDINDNVINFYRVLQEDYEILKKEVDCTLHSRSTFVECREILKDPENDKIKRAWAFWSTMQMSFGSRIGSAWAYGIKPGGCSAEYVYSRKKRFVKAFSDRLQYTSIECRPAGKVIETFDTPETFHYVDPPYVSADQGPYKGYTESDFTRELELLSNINGKFILSSYRENVLSEFTNKNGWHTKEIESPVLINNNRNGVKRKIEVLTWNYEIENEQGRFNFESPRL